MRVGQGADSVQNGSDTMLLIIFENTDEMKHLVVSFDVNYNIPANLIDSICHSHVDVLSECMRRVRGSIESYLSLIPHDTGRMAGASLDGCD